MGMKRSKKIRKELNDLILLINENEEKVQDYDHIFRTGNIGTVSKIKI
jgi:hypothetical protein